MFSLYCFSHLVNACADKDLLTRPYPEVLMSHSGKGYSMHDRHSIGPVKHIPDDTVEHVNSLEKINEVHNSI